MTVISRERGRRGRGFTVKNSLLLGAVCSRCRDGQGQPIDGAIHSLVAYAYLIKQRTLSNYRECGGRNLSCIALLDPNGLLRVR
ncbi:hypothetical protein IF1G_06155 [Cordyceps javanica]|uniref:Uncharacterized protein n=1 Tax=Cordyceps javanica TaxID=43265 RepID=A0A545V0C3_9HYPO|nr:hypothetical protein IF1G_06155 [Cordyceps javanica]